MITGKDLIEWGHVPGDWFGAAIKAANAAASDGKELREVKALVDGMKPPPVVPLRPANAAAFAQMIEAETPDEQRNLGHVLETMTELMRTPTLTGGAVMPDACPAGGLGTIPVGGVAAAEGAIHPGMHSADICCSVAITVIGDVKPKHVLETAANVTHFGGGGRATNARVALPNEIGAAFERNPILAQITDAAEAHFATQGDGNHFLFVGRLRSTDQIALVTHHGSRKPGAMLYKRGMSIADGFRQTLSPETRKQNAWIPFDTPEGETYWDALQIIRAWTKANHFAIHDLVLAGIGATAEDRFWNEHNFVFQRGDTFLHGKGATPAWDGFAPDSNGLVLIPLNMAEPILIAKGSDRHEALGFCPHGAGRNFSRSEDARRHHGVPVEDRVRRETEGLDIRFWAGKPDTGELPSAYKRADEVVRQIRAFDLAEIVDYVDPYGCIMAGDWQSDFHRRRIEAKRARRREREDRQP
ncbi:MAG: RtcB family protein [Pseudomonadota bacterium]